jgi:hypothetical protein
MMKWYNLVLKKLYRDRCFRYYVRMKVLASTEPIRYDCGVLLTGVTKSGMKRLERMIDTRKDRFCALIGEEEKSCIAGLPQLVWKQGRSERRVFGWTAYTPGNKFD